MSAKDAVCLHVSKMFKRFSDLVIRVEIDVRMLQRLALMYSFDMFCGEDCQ